jgi:ribulose-5-phosphate 4-epimerase/fuculose-1-phosphate aldolase
LDKHPVPVIQNTTREPDLIEQVQEVISRTDFAKSYAILVRDHGAYIWGQDLWETKRHAEIYHFLFEATVARAQRYPKGGN